MAETGAVNDCHSGPFRFYSKDDRGLIMADCSFAPFFAGCAGTGQIWHWDERYVESKNLLGLFRPFADLVEGVKLDEEDFQPVDLSDDRVFCMLLRGKTCTLAYVRNREDSWYHTLRDGLEAQPVEEFSFPAKEENVEVFRIWPDDESEVSVCGGKAVIRNLCSGCMLRLK